jgi:serine/threonine-protein kinase
MGAVYEAVLVKGKPISPVKIALKIVDLRSKPGAKERAISEGQVGMQIVHPSIVRCLDYVDLPEAICLFQELVDGKQSLQSQVKPGGMDPGLAVELLLPVASGLLAMHSKGYIHRDIKPENIMLNVDGQLKIADLGLAKNPHAGFQTDSRDFLGTFAYCAPEQITNTSKVTAQADQYALGCVLYELIEGRLPFLGPDYLQFAAAHLNDIPPPARKLTVQANAALLKMLEKDPANRYEDPLKALQAIQDTL